ncbi:hypothetical protein LBMAG48_00110 [Phycisphaerae bacterium]|nr:hypothetical protein LBMAG48_00110 [Phycisphaerae bacterium]
MSDFGFDVGIETSEFGGGDDIDFGGGLAGFPPGQRGKVIFSCVFLLLFSTCVSCSEIRYTLYGQTTRARVTNTYTYRPRRSGEMLSVRFRFFDTDRSERIESFSVPVDQQAAYAKGTIVDVQYIPLRPGTARKAGESLWWCATPLVVGVVVGSYQVWQVVGDFKVYKAREAKSLMRSCP